ncbi:hypothetical protein DMC25_23470 [Caulobacter sp. D4A]|uniref:alpha/beta hydrolase family protein n=1 Tax=unclassified Caulobacter TaxID=2648921 RepID=UPI000D72D436|nr:MULTISPECIES: S9 family peptidase [unclassified Caulobacter]PXA77160.1 hypothetical protein DMC25_23470 [Caulobacter sp. D4A]PXA83239.1 hypothetical protein DMC18_24820 [Caulobacter sp. D5]
MTKRIVWGVAAVLAALGQTASAQTPPASAFGRLPAVQTVSMSPAGDKLAILGGAPAARTVRFATIDQAGEAILALGDIQTVGVRWVGEDYALVGTAIWKRVGARNAYRFERNLVVDAKGKIVSSLLEGETASAYAISQPVLGVVEGDRPKVLVQGLDYIPTPEGNLGTRLVRKEAVNPLVQTLFRADVVKGRGEIAERGSPDTTTWDVDRAGEARVRIDQDMLRHDFKLLVRAKGQRNWRTLVATDREEDIRTYLGYSDAEDAVYMVQAAPDGGAQVVRIGLADGVTAPRGKPIQGSDIGLVWDPALTTPVAIVSCRERPVYEWLDPQVGAVHGALSRAFKGQDVSLTGWSRDRVRFVARVASPGTPPVWYLFDKARKEISPLGEAYPELKDAPLGQTRWLTYKARDGLEIPAYLTLPPGAPPEGGKLPLIVLPHGGPASRDGYDFDWWAQFLATRGYAVLQPQFRGSAGFGRTFEKAGEREWGGKIQTDLLDGVAQLAKDGVVDPARVCIVGASFGGYSALAGATLNPTAYRCAVSVNGVSDLPQMLGETVTAYGGASDSLRYWRSQMGTTFKDPAALTSVSPARQVSKATPPVLLVWGDQDTTVAPAQSERMRDALTAAGRPVRSVVLEGDDHYLSTSATRTKMLEEVEAFLAQNLPVKPAG